MTVSSLGSAEKSMSKLKQAIAETQVRSYVSQIKTFFVSVESALEKAFDELSKEADIDDFRETVPLSKGNARETEVENERRDSDDASSPARKRVDEKEKDREKFEDGEDNDEEVSRVSLLSQPSVDDGKEGRVSSLSQEQDPLSGPKSVRLETERDRSRQRAKLFGALERAKSFKEEARRSEFFSVAVVLVFLLRPCSFLLPFLRILLNKMIASLSLSSLLFLFLFLIEESAGSPSSSLRENKKASKNMNKKRSIEEKVDRSKDTSPKGVEEADHEETLQIEKLTSEIRQRAAAAAKEAAKNALKREKAKLKELLVSALPARETFSQLDALLSLLKDVAEKKLFVLRRHYETAFR